MQESSEKGLSTKYEAKTSLLQECPPIDIERPGIGKFDSLINKEQTPLPGHLQPNFLQEDDYAKQFYLDIGGKGIRYAWAKYFLNLSNPKEYERTKTDSPKRIVIVGAGFAGLSAAFELEQVGHKTIILELQHRVGGRAQTIRHGFSEDLYCEGGAMRLPLEKHFLVNHYIKSLDVPVRIFQKENKRAYIHLFGQNIRKQEQLYRRTIEPVIMDLKNNNYEDGWRNWVARWGKYTVGSFLLDQHESNDDGLRPWPGDAIQAYKVSTYSIIMERSLVEVLRDDLGKWWSSTMWTPKAGMQSFAEKFTGQSVGWNKNVFLSSDIQFGKKVEILKINKDRVSVHGRNTSTGKEFTIEGDAVIVTTTLSILRQMTIQDETGNKNFLKILKVIPDIHTVASTKIFLQCRSRFWEKDLGNGGCSKTNLPIGHVYYPSKDEILPNTKRGILMCFSKGQDAIMLGAQPEKEAIASAVRQVKNIHQEIDEEFEVGRMQAWTRDESAQLAFTLLNRTQNKYATETLLTTDTHPLHLAGEALSWSNGWVQGALESGLRAAYNIFCKYEKPLSM